MCTVTFTARRNGYALGMNRDEKLARVAALPAARHRLASRDVLFPSEPSGGTWLGVNDAGTALALINWYSETARVTGQTVSRGEVIKRALPSDSPALVNAALAELLLVRVNPFRLIGVFPIYKAVVEWRWNLKRLERIDHHWRTNAWISSGFDEPGAQQTRGNAFKEALGQSSVGTADWLRRLHLSHRPERGPYSTCMHRDGAATVSYTEVIMSRDKATMHYIPGAPCCTAPTPEIRLQLRR
jgi:hypothetical protein